MLDKSLDNDENQQDGNGHFQFNEHFIHMPTNVEGSCNPSSYNQTEQGSFNHVYPFHGGGNLPQTQLFYSDDHIAKIFNVPTDDLPSSCSVVTSQDDFFKDIENDPSLCFDYDPLQSNMEFGASIFDIPEYQKPDIGAFVDSKSKEESSFEEKKEDEANSQGCDTFPISNHEMNSNEVISSSVSDLGSGLRSRSGSEKGLHSETISSTSSRRSLYSEQCLSIQVNKSSTFRKRAQVSSFERTNAGAPSDAKLAVKRQLTTSTSSSTSTAKSVGGKSDTSTKRKIIAGDLERIDYRVFDSTPENPFTPMTSLSAFRQSNRLTFQNFERFNKPDDSECKYIYSPNKKEGTSLYEPRVNRKLNPEYVKTHKDSSNLASNQGNFALCPFCIPTLEDLRNLCDRMFFKRNDSNYLHHLIQFHGIFSNGELVKDPLERKWGIPRNHDGTDKDCPAVEIVKCGYCEDYIALRKTKEENAGNNRLLKYMRHVKEFHKIGKNLS
ncbi:hypothetical protein CANARDRAFT_27019 [[Candida] arabinofermentans NRRL YB-2248]|uniref:Transcription regulator Rua1 C-terminal domain-containing protein n=1 Tax=[Candida] arabinofermentans NRRL YB-2248 TaxID=983967 RepID=A0A1E4T4C3_9ASCO|nr:hypothetical protein CANARDRAFT_27019 [[Candida] arabinofermentans NRRL YB-2248]